MIKWCFNVKLFHVNTCTWEKCSDWCELQLEKCVMRLLWIVAVLSAIMFQIAPLSSIFFVILILFQSVVSKVLSECGLFVILYSPHLRIQNCLWATLNITWCWNVTKWVYIGLHIDEISAFLKTCLIIITKFLQSEFAQRKLHCTTPWECCTHLCRQSEHNVSGI